MGMEGHSYSKFWFFARHDVLVNGTWSLLAYLVASWHVIPAHGCSPFPTYTCKRFYSTLFSNVVIFPVLIPLLIDSVYYEQALVSSIVKRVKGFIKLKIALSTLHGALPDATSEELLAYDDECAICKVSLAFAFSLLLHLICHWPFQR